jgi:heme exporter protein A
MTAIVASRLTKSFGPRTALAGVDLEIGRGEFVTLVGPNGAGKTTLLRVLGTLSRPTSGTVTIGGLDPSRHGEQVRRRIGFLSHRTLLYDDLTAEQNLRFYARMYDLPRDSRRVDSLLERLGLGARRNDLVQTYSRGMKQRLSVARAVLHSPQVLLLDEPYTGLDPLAVDTLTALLQELAGQGCTVLLTTHRLDRGPNAGDRVLILHQGRIVDDRPGATLSREALSDIYRSVTA